MAAAGALQVVEACLARIRAAEPAVQAWAWLDEARALEQARALDAQPAPRAALHGVPVGVKDIIDTADMPTECGSVLHAGRRPAHDAAVVQRLRAAGAVIVGKTVTTELATYAPGKTRHPLDASRSPGGSSSGSAAAVAAGMVPLAIGTQTNGSVIRPAAFCGVLALKPSFGLIPREGILAQSPSLDQVGLFASTIDLLIDAAAVLCDAPLRDAPLTTPPRLGFVRTPIWPRASADTQRALAGVGERLGTHCRQIELPAGFDDAWDCHRTIMEAEIAFHYDEIWQRGRQQLSDSLQAQIERGRAITASDHQRALARKAQLEPAFDALFDGLDAIVTPAALGTAPPLATTGDPAFCTPWTLVGAPALNLPLARGDDGFPIGVQLVGRRGGDARLLAVARWLLRAALPVHGHRDVAAAAAVQVACKGGSGRE